MFIGWAMLVLVYTLAPLSGERSGEGRCRSGELGHPSPGARPAPTSPAERGEVIQCDSGSDK